MKKIFSFFLYSFYALILAGLVILFLKPPIPALGEFEVKIVKSGSMEPTIMTGAVVVVQAAPAYGVGDVVTFSSRDSEIPTTHRIIGTEIAEGKEYFVTKGDANEERDTNLVSANEILGKVMVDVPYLGFVLDFARQPAGFALLIGLPALLIILDELDNIWREVRRVRQMKITKEMIMPLVIAPYQPNPVKLATLTASEMVMPKPVVAKVRMMDIKPVEKKPDHNPALELKNKLPMITAHHDIRSRLTVATAGLVMIVALAGQTGSGDSLSYFSDTEASGVNNFGARALDFTVSPELANLSIVDGEFTGEDGVEVNINDGEDNFNYVVSVDFASGTMALCDDVLVNADLPLPFSGPLPSLTGNNIAFLDPWSLNFSFDEASDYVSGDTCAVNLVLTGYALSSEDQGYVDSEAVTLTFIATKTASSSPQVNATNFMVETSLEKINQPVESSETVATTTNNLVEPTPTLGESVTTEPAEITAENDNKEFETPETEPTNSDETETVEDQIETVTEGEDLGEEGVEESVTAE